MSTQTTFPRISYSQLAETALTQYDRGLLREYFAEVRSIWQKVQSNVTKVVVDLFIDAEEDIRSVVVTYYLDAKADEALGYWDMIGQELENSASGDCSAKAT